MRCGRPAEESPNWRLPAPSSSEPAGPNAPPPLQSRFLEDCERLRWRILRALAELDRAPGATSEAVAAAASGSHGAAGSPAANASASQQLAQGPRDPPISVGVVRGERLLHAMGDLAT